MIKDFPGLSFEEVKTRISKGFVNKQVLTTTKSISAIIFSNVFTLFNLLNFILIGLVFITRSYQNLLFAGVVISNLAIGIIQEIKVKQVLDRLTFKVAGEYEVVRAEKMWLLKESDLVLDDVYYLEAGQQVPTDAVVCVSTLEVNESLITGEALPILKESGSKLISGSVVVSGRALVKATQVGTNSYLNMLLNKSRVFAKHHGELKNTLNLILKQTSFIIIPLGILTFFKQFFFSEATLTEIILTTVAAVLGMIPEGLFLLTSVALALGVIRLSQKGALVQELDCIETLARVDVLCLDKTGTLTSGLIELESVVSDYNLEEIIGNLIVVSRNKNATLEALAQKFVPQKKFKLKKVYDFNSGRKYSGAYFEEGTYILGARETLFPNLDLEVAIKAEKQGKRVLVLGKTKGDFKVNSNLEYLGCFIFNDEIRSSVEDTLRYFKDQGVTLKIISGDNLTTVSTIASLVGLEGSQEGLDCSTCDEDTDWEVLASSYTIFTRVTPEQKANLIKGLKKQHVVAMMGDGVNDLLAIKEADCSLALSSGSDALTKVANIVLLENDFSLLPQIVAEGRRVINNISRSASLFLVKTFFSILLSVYLVFFSNQYPFLPVQLTLISTLTVGVPSFFLALEPNFQQIKGKFFKKVLLKAIPGAITILCIVILLNILGSFNLIENNFIQTYIVYLTVINGFVVLWRVSIPFTKLRLGMFLALVLLFYTSIFFFSDFFFLEIMKVQDLGIILPLHLIVMGLNFIFTKIFHYLIK